MKANKVSFKCDSLDNLFNVQDILKENKIIIGDTGTSTVTGIRDLQIPANQSKKAVKIIKGIKECQFVSMKKDIDIRL